MRNPALLWPMALIVLFLAACSDDPTAPGPSARDTVLTQTWADGELSAVAYDPMTDNLFLLEDVHSGENVIHRWSFADEELTEVFRSSSQHDYGMRMLDGELWVTRTYDKGFYRLGDLDQNTLTERATYEFPGVDSKATEACDVAELQGNILFVAGNPLGSEQHDGIQSLVGPGFATISEVLSETKASWDVPTHGFFRSILVVGSLPNERLVVTTGPREGQLISYDLQGNERFRAEGFGSSYLQKDSQDRIYAIESSTGDIVRWSSDFQTSEAFRFGVSGRFVLRETDTNVEFIYADFRSEETQVRRIQLPQ